MRTVIAVCLVAALGFLSTGDASASWPFRNLWEKRRAELYAQLSRDVTRRVDARVAAAHGDLEATLSSRVAAETSALKDQARTDVVALENLFDTECDELDARFEKERREIDDSLAAQAKQLSAVTDAKQMEALAKVETELRRIERQSAAEVEKLLATTGKRIDAEMSRLEAEMANLKTRLDDRFASLAKRLEEEQRAAAAATPSDADPSGAPAEPATEGGPLEE